MTDTARQRREIRDSVATDTGRSVPVLFVVDDDLATLALLYDVAEASGWSTRPFTRLRDFEAALRVRRPDLVILDDDLPDGSGGDRARELAVDRRMNGVPVLVCTAAHPMRQAEIGAWAPVISKPFDLDEIERFLDAVAGDRAPMGGQAAG